MSECKTIAVCNQKIGAGKTTTAVNLGAGLVRAGRRVLLVDCDPQGDLTQSLEYQADELDQSLGRLMYMATQDCKPVVGDTIRTNYGMSIKIFDMTMFTRHMSLVSYLQQVQIALIMIRRLMESQLSKKPIDLWIVAASVKWMLLFIKDSEKVIR